MTPMSGFIDAIAARVGGLVSGNIGTQISRAVTGLGPGGSSRGSSSHAGNLPPGSDWASGRLRSILGPNSAPSRFAHSAGRFIATQKAKRAKRRYRRSQAMLSGLPGRGTAGFNANQWKRASERVERDRDAYRAANSDVRGFSGPARGLISQLTRKDGRPEQYRYNSNNLNAQSPQGLVNQMMRMQKERSMAKSNNLNWLKTRQSPLELIKRSKRAAEKAATLYKHNLSRMQALRTVVAKATNRLRSAPKEGEIGHDPARTKSLANQVAIASKTFSAAETRTANSLQMLSKTSAMYAGSTNAAAVAMRVIGSGLAKFAGPIALAVTAISAAGKFMWDLPTRIERFGDSIMESRRWAAGSSMRAAAVFNQYDRVTDNLKHRQAEMMAPMLELFAAEHNRFRENIMPFKSFASQIGPAIGYLIEQEANKPFTAAEEFGIAIEAFKNGKLLDPEFWKNARKELEDIKKENREKFDSTFPDMLRAHSFVSDDKRDARNNNRKKDVLPPLK